MRPRTSDARRLNVAALCKAGGDLAGQWPLHELTRLAGSAAEGTASPATDPPQPPVAWSVRAEQRRARGGAVELWLHLKVAAEVPLQCQRCLGPMAQPLAIDRSLRFVEGEDEAARLDEESEDDVLALPPRLDLRELVEDELILALPVVPRHEVCPVPLQMSSEPEGVAGVGAGVRDGEGPAPSRPNPFAVLGRLRRGGDDTGSAG